MFKKIINNRILVCSLLVIVFLCYAIKPMVGKYVYTSTGRAMSSLISGNILTDSFILTNDSFVQENADGTTTTLNEKTSNSLHGVGMERSEDGVLTVPGNADTDKYDLDSTSSLSFVVQNNSDYDLVACFDIILCMGAISDGVLTCTITAPPASETVTEKTTLTVSASTGADTDIKLKNHKEPGGKGGKDDPVIDVQIKGWISSVNYSAYSMQLDPTAFLGDRNGDGDDLDENELTKEEFESFILVRSGETKTFEFNVKADQNIIGQWFSKNCYASITMTVKKYEQGS